MPQAAICFQIFAAEFGRAKISKQKRTDTHTPHQTQRRKKEAAAKKSRRTPIGSEKASEERRSAACRPRRRPMPACQHPRPGWSVSVSVVRCLFHVYGIAWQPARRRVWSREGGPSLSLRWRLSCRSNEDTHKVRAVANGSEPFGGGHTKTQNTTKERLGCVRSPAARSLALVWGEPPWHASPKPGSIARFLVKSRGTVHRAVVNSPTLMHGVLHGGAVCVSERSCSSSATHAYGYTPTHTRTRRQKRRRFFFVSFLPFLQGLTLV